MCVAGASLLFERCPLLHKWHLSASLARLRELTLLVFFLGSGWLSLDLSVDGVLDGVSWLSFVSCCVMMLWIQWIVSPVVVEEDLLVSLYWLS